MKYTMYLTKAQKDELEYEVISNDLKIYLTRKLRKWAEEPDDLYDILIRKNRLINLSRTIAGDKIYVLEPDDWGHYWQQEYAWHDGDFELIFRRLFTLQFIEFVGDLIEQELLTIDEINRLLGEDGASFKFIMRDDGLALAVSPLEDLDKELADSTHPNIRILVNRMDKCLASDDYAGVLHASATIFETLAKDIVGISTIQNQTLKSFFERYKKDSLLPEPILDYILNIYDRRSVVPLAGHGSTQQPQISKEQAIVLSEMTKAFVKSEYKLKV